MDTGGEVRQPGTRQGGKEKRSSPPKANIPLEKVHQMKPFLKKTVLREDL